MSGFIGEHTGHCRHAGRWCPKVDGKQRPLAVAALEDKIVQRATVAVLNAIYEEDFLGFSYGFRPKRGQHDALDALQASVTSPRKSRRRERHIGRGAFARLAPAPVLPAGSAQSRPASHRRQLCYPQDPAVRRWLKRHSRFHLHFTPTSGSWLNMVERFFAEITRNAFAAASSRASTN